MKERFLFLSNEATIGIFNFSEHTTFVAISCEGNYVKIFNGESRSTHLTRFCPVNSLPLVKRLLNFRNQFASQPYLCNRFHESNSESFFGSIEVEWKQNPDIDQNSIDGWNIHHSLNRRCVFALCPFKKRLCYLSDATYCPDTAESGKPKEIRSIRHLTVIPLSSAPFTIKDINEGRITIDFKTHLPSSAEGTAAENSSAACSFFDEIEHELLTLKSLNKYPTSVNFAAKIERIDGDVFMCTSLLQGNINPLIEDLVIESWIHRKPHKNSHNDKVNSINSNEDNNSKGCDEKDMLLIQQECNGTGPLLTLKGNYFTFYKYPSSSTSSGGYSSYKEPSSIEHSSKEYSPSTVESFSGIAIHVSLFEKYETVSSHNENNIPYYDNNDNNNNNNDNSNNYDNDRNNDNKNNNNNNKNSDSHNRNDSLFTIQDILECYYFHALRLLEFREYLEHRRGAIKNSTYVPYCLQRLESNDRNINISSSNFPNSTRLNIDDNDSQKENNGGVYTVKNGRLIEASRGEIITSIPEIFNKFDTYNINKRDCQQELHQQYEDNVVKLSSNGTIYTALPLFSSTDFGLIRTTGIPSGINEIILRGKRMFSSVRGTFPDHTQVELCLHTRIVKALLSDGEEYSCTLSEALNPIQSTALHSTLKVIKGAVSSLLSFLPFACAPPAERSGIFVQALAREVTVKAAVLRSQRHLAIEGFRGDGNKSNSNIQNNYKSSHNETTHLISPSKNYNNDYDNKNQNGDSIKTNFSILNIPNNYKDSHNETTHNSSLASTSMKYDNRNQNHKNDDGIVCFHDGERIREAMRNSMRALESNQLILQQRAQIQ